MADAATDHLNEDHADTVLFLARALAVPGARSAAIRGADLAGVDLVVDGEPARVEFDEPVTDPDAVWDAAMGLLARARATAPAGEPLTSLERDLALTESARVFLTRVVRTRQVTPHLREITFAGGLEGFRPLAPDQWFWVLLPPVPVPAGSSLGDIRALPPEAQPNGKNYTVRRFDQATGELDIWFVLHGDDGPCSAWAGRAEVGDEVGLWGPRAAFEPPAGTERLLLLADETGLPATLAILESRPEAEAIALVEVEDAADEVPGADGRVRWIHRAGGGSLAGAVAELDLGDGTGWYAWGGAESRAITEIRRHLRDGVGFPREGCCLVGYWRR